MRRQTGASPSLARFVRRGKEVGRESSLPEESRNEGGAGRKGLDVREERSERGRDEDSRRTLREEGENRRSLGTEALICETDAP